MKTRLFLLAALAIALTACGTSQPVGPVGTLTDALDNGAWDVSQWISVVDAPVAAGNASKSAPGANWFLSTVKNGKRVTKAVWMTAGLGVYDIYLNGELVGKEVLKPGFTHNGKFLHL